MPDLVIHAFTDGRDTSPTGGEGYLATVEGWCAEAGNARIGSVIGRYFAMDRDKRWDRVQLAYDLLVHGRARASRRRGARRRATAYERGETDEFIAATTVGDEARDPPRRQRHRVQLPARPHARDHARARRPGFADVDRGGAAPVARYATLTEYEEGWPYPVAFAPERPA